MNRIRYFITDAIQKGAVATIFDYCIKITLNLLSTILVPMLLAEEAQGFWYTFGSIAALTTFADLGFTTIMAQFAAHEFAYLQFSGKKIIGNHEKMVRLSSLFRFVIRWITIALSCATIIIFTTGLIIFSRDKSGIPWLPQWSLFTIGTIVNFYLEVLLSFFEGCDQFRNARKIRAGASIVHGLSLIVFLLIGGGLYALGGALMCKSIVTFYFLFKIFGKAIKQFVREKLRADVRWGNEIIPLLGRYAISWVSGYFAMQIYNPIVFSMYGSAAAGKVGLTLSIVQSIYTVANVWSLVSIPKYNIAVEKKEWTQMDRLLVHNIQYSLLLYCFGVIVLFGTRHISLINEVIWSRIMPEFTVITIVINYFITIISYALSTYLRSHKKEPFMIPSVMVGALGTILTIWFLSNVGVNYVFCGLLLANAVVLPVSLYIWVVCRKKWHTT